MSKLVFKILPPSATFHGLDYNERKCIKGTARLLHHANFGLLQGESQAPSKKDMKSYMEMISSANKRIRNKQFHAIVSCKGKMFSFEQLTSHAFEIMIGLGYGDHPIAIYGHTDTENYHAHIVTTRIGIDGKKVPHHFEGKRANELLNQITLTDKKQLFEAELDHSLGYSFSSVAQFRLLMEQKGYRVQVVGDNLEFFKYGTKQASIPIQTVNSKINAAILPNLQMKAIIRKYRNPYNIVPIQSPKEKYSTAKKGYRTTLTEVLYKKFGWQFVFFKNAKHDKPYGYLIIDHNKKVVYKGSDIIPLQQLLSPVGDVPGLMTSISKEDALLDHHQQITPGPGQSSGHSEKPDVAGPIKEIDRIIGQAEFDAEQELRKAQDPKRKRGRYL